MRRYSRCAACAILLSLACALPVPAQVSEPAYRPPRSVADIVGAVGALTQDQATLERHRQRLASEPPAGASSRDQVIFHYLRARSAEALGDTPRQIQDDRKALELSRPGESYAPVIMYRGWLTTTLAYAEQSRGNYAEGVRLQRQAIAESESDPFWRLVALAGLMPLQGRTGQMAELDESLKLAESTYAELRRRDGWPIYGLLWTRWYENVRSWHHYFNGRLVEAELAALRGMRAGEAFIPVSDTHRARGVPMGAPGLQRELHELMLTNLAFIQAAQNKLDEAEFHARQALASVLSRNRHLNPHLRAPLSRLGEIMLNRGRFTDAEAMFREVLRVLDASGAARGSGNVLLEQRNLMRALAARGRWQDAAGVFRDAQKAAGEGAARNFTLIDTPAAYALLRAGDATAAAAIDERLAGYRKNGLEELPEAVLLRGVHALALSEGGRAAEAEREFAEVIPKLAGRGAPSVLAADATAFVELQKRWILEGYLDHLRRKGSQAATEEALSVSDAVRGRGVQLAIHQASLRAAAATPALAELARKEQDLRNEVSALYSVLNARVGASGGQAGSIEQQMRARIAAATEEAGRIAERMRKEFAGYADLVAPRLPELAQLRAALKPEEALLALHLAGDRAYAWLVRREGPVAFHSVEGRAAIESDVRLLRRALDPNSFGIRGAIPDFNLPAAHRLYQKLVQPLEASLAGIAHLVVVANGALQQLPLSVLVTQAQAVTPDAALHYREYRTVPWLAARYAISQAPSVSAFLSLRARPPGKEGRLAFAGFGDPLFSKEQTAAAPASGIELRGKPLALRSAPQTWTLDSAQLSRLPRLPDTAEEIVSIAKALGAVPERDTFLGARATEREAKRADLASRKVVAFATHGLVPGELDGLSQPALALSAPEVAGAQDDGLLTMEEVLQLKLDADWVVLSACNTGAGEGAGAEAISGLGRAFFYAGARSLLVSGWPVETVSAKLLTTRIFELQAADPKLGRAEGLRRSMLELIERGEGRGADGKPEFAYAHPLFWAPFSVVGDGN